MEMQQDLGFARLDLDRAARTGDPEVVFGSGKTPEQIVAALQALSKAHDGRAILATRAGPEARELCRELIAGAEIDDEAQTVIVGQLTEPHGTVAIVCAGTADLPVARECATVVRVFGSSPDLIVDVGVAGLHRLLSERGRISRADVVVAIAGMEAALPSVLGGLVGVPLIALPTSVGYGWNLDGLTAFLAVLNSCAAGVVAVNVDNGFGAGVAAARIARRTPPPPPPPHPHAIPHPGATPPPDAISHPEAVPRPEPAQRGEVQRPEAGRGAEAAPDGKAET
jgi:NCAIR mutase (PurE)-related protein